MESTEELRDALLALQRENARLSVETAQSRLLVNAMEQLLSDDSADPFASVFPALRAAFDFSDVVVLTERENSEKLVCTVAEPVRLLDSEWKKKHFLTRVLAGRVATTITNEQISEWTDLPTPLLSARQPALYIPLKVDENRSLMILFRKVGEEGFDRNHVKLAREFALLASLALAAKAHKQNAAERARLEVLTERLRASEALLTRRANYDHLTGLPNREFTQELLERAISLPDSQSTVVAFIDIDDFKRINDNFGHSVGDQLLRQISSRLRDCLSASDIVGRISGDEFVAAFSGKELDAALQLAERMRQRLSQSYLINGIELRSTATIGIARCPQDGTSYAELHRAADIAMYNAKSEAKGSIGLYSPQLGDIASKTAKLEQDLRTAIAERRFRCLFQPKIDIRRGRVVGFEALARWQQRNGALRGPHEFIEQAASLNLLDDITSLIVDDLLVRVPALDKAFGPDMRYSINISAKQIGRLGFLRSIVEKCAVLQNRNKLIFEVTEDALVDPQLFASSVLPLLKASGVALSIDDFGKGYSSLSTLTNLPADELKVDRSFITGISERHRSQSVLAAIESLAGTLRLSVVAEGVETIDELRYLRHHTAIEVAQGFLFARPGWAPDLIRNFDVEKVFSGFEIGQKVA